MDYSKKSKEELIKEIELLKSKEENISTVLYSINEMFYKISFDENGKKNIDYISPQVENVLGLTTEEYINNKDILFEHFHPEELEKLIEEAKKMNKDHKQWSFTYRFYHKKLKKYVWIEETIVPIYNNKGKKTGLLGTARDVSKNRIREKQLSFILENIDECIYNVRFEKEGKELNFISKQIKDITGLTIEEYEKEGKSGKLIKRIHPDDVGIINRNIDQDMYEKNKKQIHSVFRFKPKGSQKYLWLEETLHISYDSNKKPLETTTVIRDITKNKTIELHLKENEEKYRNLFTKNLAGVFITDKGIIIECNNSFAKIFGYKTRVELIGRKATDLYFSLKEREDYIKELKKKGSLSNYKIRHKKKDGSEMWILTNVSIKENRVEGTLVDITEQIKTEQRLKESEKNYKELIESSPYGVIVHRKGEILFANPEALKIFEIKNINQIKTKSIDFLLKEYQHETKKRRKMLEEGKNIPFIDVKIKTPTTNKIIDIESKSMLINYKGEKAIQVVFKDITLEKELEKEKLRTKVAEESNKILQKEIIERAKVEKKLIENQKYTNSIINSSLDVICAADINGNIIEINKAGAKTFGYKEKELLNQKVELLYSDKRESQKIIKKLAKDGIFVGEVKNKRKNGQLFTSFLSASLLYDQEGNTIGSMGVSRDITEMKKAEQQLIESEEKYRDLFENATDLIQSINTKGNIIYVNNAWKKATGYSSNELKNKNIFDIIHPDSYNHCQEFFKNILQQNNNKATKVIYALKTKKGKKITVEGSVSVKYKDGKADSTRAILRDVTEEIWDKTLQNVYNNVAKIITEKIKPEEIYEGIRKELGKVINTDVFAISYLLDKDTVTFPYYYDITRKGRLNVANRYRKKGLNEYMIKYGKPKIMYKKEWDTIVKKGEYKIYGPEAEVFIGVPLKIKNKVIGIVSVQSYKDKNLLDEKALQILDFISGALALTVQRKYDEAIIYDQSARLESIIESSTHLFWSFNKNLGLTIFNKNFEKYIKEAYGRIPETNTYVPGKMVRASDKEEQPFWDEKYKEAYKGKQQNFITDQQTGKGERIVKEVFLNPIYDDDGKVSEISGIAHDITEKTKAEEKLKESLKEKEILLKEVHHRVKNNLQVISSILNLQSSYVKEESTLNILKESQNRIKSMAFIHESLYQNNDFSKINFSEYVVSLSKNLVHSYGVYDDFVDLHMEVGEVFLNIDLSIPCGLIINELVSNSLKYAFSERENREIGVEMFVKTGNVHLIVYDNGWGLPKEINYKNTESLGLQLVMTLVEQLNGTIKLDNKKGAKYTIIFKKEQ